MQEEKFGAETRAEGGGHRVFARFERALFQPLLQDEKNRGAREIADVAENIPGGLCVTFAKAQFFFDIAQQARAARMQNPSFNVFLFAAVAFEEAVHQAANLPADHLGDVFREQNVESRITQVETHGVQRIRERVGL